MKIGVFGGTFDPIHHGHLALARAAQKQLGLDKVLFIPAFIPPHKAGEVTPAAYRYRMVELAVSDEPEFEISDLEFNRPEISYTADTLRQLKKIYPDAELFLIVGADCLVAMPSSWKEPEEIVKLAQLAAAKRPGFKAEDFKNVRWIDMPQSPLSSTAVRESLKRGENGNQFFPAKVAQYVRKMKLYGVS